MMNSVQEKVHDLAVASRRAARVLRAATTAQKNRGLAAIADRIERDVAEIIAANEADLSRGWDDLSEALRDRLRLTEQRISDIAGAVRELIALPDPVGDVDLGRTLENGLVVRRVRVPMGVIGMIYEARPNVTVDAAALALKSGNAVLLRGGSAAEQTNAVLVRLMREALESAGLPGDAVASVDEFGRDGAKALMRARGDLDLLIPRGGAGLIRTVVEESLVPVIETGVGNCHVFVEASADRRVAADIVLNAKTHRPGVCNAAETLLIDSGYTHGADLIAELVGAGVRVHGCERSRELAEPAGVAIDAASEEDWGREYLAMEMAVAVVDGLDGALAHIAAHSSGHTEAIVTTSLPVARAFTAGVDSAAVMVNASTRFTDGGQLGLGAEIGISTQKLHARGPMGLAELTTVTWVVEGQGHIRG